LYLETSQTSSNVGENKNYVSPTAAVANFTCELLLTQKQKWSPVPVALASVYSFELLSSFDPTVRDEFF